MRHLIATLLVLALLTACSATPTPTTAPEPSTLPTFTAAQVTSFYQGQVVFYSVEPKTTDATMPAWYTIDQGATLVNEAIARNDSAKVNSLPFTIQTITDPLALAFYYGYGSACSSAPDSFDNRTNGKKRFIDTECGNLTSQAVTNDYYGQNSAIPAP